MSLDTLITTKTLHIPSGTVLTQYPPRHEVSQIGGLWDLRGTTNVGNLSSNGLISINHYYPEGIWGMQPVFVPETDRDEIHDNANFGSFKYYVLRAYDARDFTNPSSTLVPSQYTEAAIFRAPMFADMELYVFGQLHSGNTASNFYNTNTLTFEDVDTTNLKYALAAAAEQHGVDTPLFLDLHTRSFANQIWDFDGRAHGHMLEYFNDGGLHTHMENTGNPLVMPRFFELNSENRFGTLYKSFRAFHPTREDRWIGGIDELIPFGSGTRRPFATLHLANWPTAHENKQHGYIELKDDETDFGVLFPNWKISLDPSKASIFSDGGQPTFGNLYTGITASSTPTDIWKGIDYNPYLEYQPADDLDITAGETGICEATAEIDTAQRRGFEFYQEFTDVSGYTGFAIGRVVFQHNIQILTTNLDSFGTEINAELDAQEALHQLIMKNTPNWNITKVLIPKD